MSKVSLLFSWIVASIAVAWIMVDFKVDEIAMHDRWFGLGTVASTSAKIWVWSPNCTEFEILWQARGEDRWDIRQIVGISEETDWVSVVYLENLQPQTGYTYYVRWNQLLPGQRDLIQKKRFTTHPVEGSPCTLSFVFGSCLTVFPIFPPSILNEMFGDFAIFLGDSHYSDLTSFSQRHSLRMLASSKEFQNLTSRMGMYSMYDDHELRNNYDAGNETDFFKESIRWWQLYVGSKNPDPIVPWSYYFAFNYGDVGFFVMDTRAHRSFNAMPDGPDKTMLGAEQKKYFLKWLKQPHRVKVVASPVPFTNAAVIPADGWPLFNTEKEELLNAMEAQPSPILLLSGDMHWAGIFQLRDKIFEASASPWHSVPFKVPGSNPETVFASGVGFHFGRVAIVTEGKKPKLQVDIFKKMFGDSVWVTTKEWSLDELSRGKKGRVIISDESDGESDSSSNDNIPNFNNNKRSNSDNDDNTAPKYSIDNSDNEEMLMRDASTAEFMEKMKKRSEQRKY